MPNHPRRDQVTDWLGMQDAPVTVAQICAGAGVSRPTAYKYVAELSAGGTPDRRLHAARDRPATG